MRVFILLFFLPLICFSQVGINTTNPNASLDIRSSNVATPTNTDGILIPKIDEYPAVNPTVTQDGMLVYATGNGSVTKGFYYWNNSTTSWVSFSGTTIEKIDDLIDGKSDNDGTDNGSSIFLGVNAGANDDETNNGNVGIGYETMENNISGSYNSSFGMNAMYFNYFGSNNVAIGRNSLFDNYDANNNTAVGANAGRYTNGSNNVFLGYESGGDGLIDEKEGNVFVGYQAGYSESNSNRLCIENSSSTSPLIYGEFDNDFLRVNGDFEIKRNINASASVVTPFGYQSSLKLFERGTGGDYGFEFQYDGVLDKFHLWSRTFASNEGQRMTWLKDGRVGINDTSPTALLDIEATNSATPTNTDGILIPRVDAFPASNPTADQNGMLVFLTTDNSFYYWKNSTSSWVSVSSVQKINDLIDGKSDNNGSSIFLGIAAGLNDDSTNNRNVSLGYRTLNTNVSGSGNIAIGYQAGYFETNSNRLYIENSSSTLPLIYGEFDNNLLRVNGDVEVEKYTDASITVKTPFGDKSSLKLFESGGSGDYGFEFQYDGAPDKLHLWSRTFAGNEGIRMTWLKDGKVGINDTAPIALLDIEAANSATPANTDGILIPRVDAFPATNPTAVQNGMLLFLTTDNTFYYWKNNTSSWVSVSSVQKINDLSDGKSDDDGSNNGSSIFLGVNAGAIDNETNNRNVGIGYDAMSSNVTGANNTAIGSYSGPLVPGISNTTAIGYNAAPLGSNQVRIGNTSVSIIGGSVAWSVISDKRLKTNIKEDIAGLDFIKKLRPVSYNLDMDAIARFEKTPDSLRLRDAELLKAQEIQTGFIAQEVEAAAKAVGFDFHGIVKPYNSNSIYSLRYAEFVVPLVKAMQEQQGIIESQQEDIDALKREIEEIKALLRQD